MRVDREDALAFRRDFSNEPLLRGVVCFFISYVRRGLFAAAAYFVCDSDAYSVDLGR